MTGTISVFAAAVFITAVGMLLLVASSSLANHPCSRDSGFFVGVLAVMSGAAHSVAMALVYLAGRA